MRRENLRFLALFFIGLFILLILDSTIKITHLENIIKVTSFENASCIYNKTNDLREKYFTCTKTCYDENPLSISCTHYWPPYSRGDNLTKYSRECQDFFKMDNCRADCINLIFSCSRYRNRYGLEADVKLAKELGLK